MDVPQFCFHVFPPFIRNLLAKFCYTDLVSTFKNIDPAIRFLIFSCADVFFHRKSETEEIRAIGIQETCEKTPHCLETAQTLLDIIWEKLNTGCWKDVDLCYRYAYSYTSLFKALCLILGTAVEKKDIIKICDMGILMGAPILDNALCKIASELMSQCSDTDSSFCSEENNHVDKKMKPDDEKVDFKHPVKTIHWVTCDNFLDSFMKMREPVLLLLALRHWPAFSSHKWNVDYILKTCRYRTVPVEIGSKYTDKNWTQKLMTMEHFIQNYIWKKNDAEQVGYVAQHNLFVQIPELKEDLGIPSLIKSVLTKERGEFSDDDVDINAWFGPGNTISPLHYDRKHNLLVQVMGEKYVRLYAKEHTHLLYPREGTIFDNTSHVDVEHPDLETYPLFVKAPYQECLLRTGNMLYIPPECWHYVRSCSVSFSVSFWW